MINHKTKSPYKEQETNNIIDIYSAHPLLAELTFGESESSLSKADGKLSKEAICITVFSSGAHC